MERFILKGLIPLVPVLIAIIIVDLRLNHELLAAEIGLQDQRAVPIDSVTVHTVSFSGNSVVSSGDLSQMVQPYINRPLTLAELDEMANVVTALYQQKGFALARAYLPAQQITGGEFHIVILEGRLSDIAITGNRWYSTSYILRGFSPVPRDQPIRQESLERALLVLNDTMDLKVKATLAPGNTPGTTKILATAEDKLPIHVGLDMNNFGFASISRYRFGGTVEAGNALIPGSALTLNGIVGPAESVLL